jgi:transglutaminase-like putative cysteine protease
MSSCSCVRWWSVGCAAVAFFLGSAAANLVRGGDPASAAAPPDAEDILAETVRQNSDRDAPPPAPARKQRLTRLQPQGFKAHFKSPTQLRVQLPSRQALLTPAVADGRIFVGGGFQSTEFYCVSADNGEPIWGARLPDNGPSAPAYYNGTLNFNMPRFISVALLLLPVLSAFQRISNGGDELKLEPDLPYRAARLNPVTYDVDFSAVVTPAYKGKVLKVWLPLPQSDVGQEVTEGSLDSFPIALEPKIGTEKVFGNKFAYFEFHDVAGAQIIRHKFKVTVWELRWNIDPAKVVNVINWPASFDPYRKGEAQAVVVDDRFEKQLRQVVPHPGNPLVDMSAVMDWVIADFKYDHNDASLQASAVHALEKRHGHCSDYHGFCASMGRALGCPTRVAYGMNPFPKNSPSHCKLEVFLAPYGWVSFDVSETQNLLAIIAKDPNLDDAARKRYMRLAKERLLSGFRDNTWFLQTKGTDYDLEPPARKKVAVVRTIYAEADGVALPEPDPANTKHNTYAWMTIHKFKPDRPVTYPFTDFQSLR